MNASNYYSNFNTTTTNTSNNETSTLSGQQWSMFTIVNIITLITGVLSNGTVLFVFLKNRTLRTSAFNIYVMNLVIVNLSWTLIQCPLDFISNLHGGAWTLSEQACQVYLYAYWILILLIENSHMLIAINRIARVGDVDQVALRAGAVAGTPEPAGPAA